MAKDEVAPGPHSNGRAAAPQQFLQKPIFEQEAKFLFNLVRDGAIAGGPERSQREIHASGLFGLTQDELDRVRKHENRADRKGHQAPKIKNYVTLKEVKAMAGRFQARRWSEADLPYIKCVRKKPEAVYKFNDSSYIAYPLEARIAISLIHRADERVVDKEISIDEFVSSCTDDSLNFPVTREQIMRDLSKLGAKRYIEFESSRSFIRVCEKMRNELRLIEKIATIDLPSIKLAKTDLPVQFRPIEPPTAPAVSSPRIVNSPPKNTPPHFQGRTLYSKQVCDFLTDDSKRMLMIVGRRGTGKTTLACRVLESALSGRLIDGRPFAPQGVVYLDKNVRPGPSALNLYRSLLSFLPLDRAMKFSADYKIPSLTVRDCFSNLLPEFQTGAVLLLLDNFEDFVDRVTLNIADREMAEALRAILETPAHSIKVIITTQIAPRDLQLTEPGNQMRLTFTGEAEGLSPSESAQMLREMDIDGTLGLKKLPDELLQNAGSRTRGFPRALEALFGLLTADRSASLQDVLRDWEVRNPENVIAEIVGIAFSRLDPTSQLLMKTLAIFGEPIPVSGVNFLIAPFQPGASSNGLDQLVKMLFVNKSDGKYWLHSIDQEYVLSLVPAGNELPGDVVPDTAQFNRRYLWSRAADYFDGLRKQISAPERLEDLKPYLAVIDFCCKSGGYNRAAVVLEKIDFSCLDSWGYFAMARDLHESLKGKLTDPSAISHNLHVLGSELFRLAQYDTAIGYARKTIEVAETMGDEFTKARCLYLIGCCHGDRADTNQALEYFMKALKMTEPRDGQATALIGDTFKAGWVRNRTLNNLGYFIVDTGQIKEAAKFHRDGLKIAMHIKDYVAATLHQCNFGARLTEQGHASEAIRQCEKALDLGRRIGFRYGEALTLNYLGNAYADLSKWNDASELYSKAMEIADETGSWENAVSARIGLTIVRLSRNDFVNARTSIIESGRYDVPRSDYRVPFLLGLVELRMSNRPNAVRGFQAALKKSNALLAVCPQNYGVWEINGLAKIGLSLVEGRTRLLPDVSAAFNKARGICSEKGVVERALRLFDLLVTPKSRERFLSLRTQLTGQAQTATLI